jgi:hypothetical protein
VLANELRFAKNIASNFKPKENKQDELPKAASTAKGKHLLKMFVKGVKNQNSEELGVVKSKRKSSIYDQIFDIKRVNSLLPPKHQRVSSQNISSKGTKFNI